MSHAEDDRSFAGGPSPELAALAGNYKRIPVYKKIPAKGITAPDLFPVFKNISRQCFILESLEDPERWGRWTFIGWDPKLEVSCIDGRLRIKNGAALEFDTGDPGSYIRKILADNASPALPELPPFAGGLVGYFGYDYIKYSEPSLKLNAADEEGFKDVDLMLFDRIVAFDNREGEIIIIINVSVDGFDENYRRALGELDHIALLIEKGERAAIPPLRVKSAFRPLFTTEKYCALVEEAKRHIREGDIFQAVLSNRLDADAEGSLFGAYRVLRERNPSPYMFYFSSDDLEIAGASPETLVRLEDGALFTFPLAGTRRRGATEAEDKLLEKELLSDEKELAEHNMLVDLGRNDIGKISRFGTVELEKYLSIERFSHVMHIGSTVRGRILEGKGALDAVDAVLPAGTLSGAPKIRACEIIDRLENCKRGIYGGAIGYIAFTGNLDVCIAIRIAYKKNGKVFVRSGAGIVADSVPEKEAEECGRKMEAVIQALKEGM